MGETPKLDPEGLEAASEALYHLAKGQNWPGTLDGRPTKHVGTITAAEVAVRAYLSSAGLSVSLTEEEMRALIRATGDGRLPDLEVSEAEVSAVNKLRAALASSGEER